MILTSKLVLVSYKVDTFDMTEHSLLFAQTYLASIILKAFPLAMIYVKTELK